VDVARGWEAAFRRLGFQVDAWPYHDCITFYDAAFKMWAEKTPSFQYDPGASMYYAARGAIASLVERPPDVVVVVTGLALHVCFYEAVKRLGLKLVMVLTESPYADKMQLDMCRAVRPDLVLVNEWRSLDKFREFNAAYLPHSYDSERHRPQEVELDYQSDVCFVGTVYPERRALLDGVNWVGIRTNFQLQELADLIPLRVRNEEAAKMYCGAKVNLNLHRTVMGATAGSLQHAAPDDVWSLGPRAYEIAACGGFQIAQAGRGELDEVFEGSVPVFQTAREMEALVRYYLERDDERRRLAERQRECVRGCSFEERARTLMIPKMEGLWQEQASHDSPASTA